MILGEDKTGFTGFLFQEGNNLSRDAGITGGIRSLRAGGRLMYLCGFLVGENPVTQMRFLLGKRISTE